MGWGTPTKVKEVALGLTNNKPKCTRKSKETNTKLKQQIYRPGIQLSSRAPAWQVLGPKLDSRFPQKTANLKKPKRKTEAKSPN